MKIHHLAPFALFAVGAQGHGLTIYVNKCGESVTTTCCDLSNAPDSVNANHKEPDFGRTIFPNNAFSINPDAPQLYVADLGVEHRGSVWDATNPECADGEGDDKSPGPCWRFEPDGSDFPAFTPFRCSKEDSFGFFSINIAEPLQYWNGKEFVETPNGERMKIYGQDWPEPSVLEEPQNPLGAGKWAAVLGASTLSPRSLEEGPVVGADIPSTEIEWTSAGLEKGQTTPYRFESTFEKDLSWGEDENWKDVTSGLKWGDHEHYLYQLTDANGDLCVKGTSPDDCSNGVYYLAITVTVDGVTSAPIQILFARGVEMEGTAMQSAFAQLQSKAESQMKAAASSPGSDNAFALGVAGLAVAGVAFLVALYAAFKKPPVAAGPKPVELGEQANVAIN